MDIDPPGHASGSEVQAALESTGDGAQSYDEMWYQTSKHLQKPVGRKRSREIDDMFGFKRRAVGDGDQPIEVTHHSMMSQFPSGEFLQPSPLERTSVSTGSAGFQSQYGLSSASSSQHPGARPALAQQQGHPNFSNGSAGGGGGNNVIVQAGFPSMLSGTFGGGRPNIRLSGTFGGGRPNSMLSGTFGGGRPNVMSSHRSVNIHTFNEQHVQFGPRNPGAPPQIAPHPAILARFQQEHHHAPPAFEFSDSSFASAPSREPTGTTSASSVPNLEQNIIERDLGHLNL